MVEFSTIRMRHGAKLRVLMVLMGVAINVLPSLAVSKLEIPIYLDTVGTIFVTLIGGIFPGVMTAFFSNFLLNFYNPGTLYFAFINIMVALYTDYFFLRHSTKKFYDMLHYVAISGAVCGCLGAIVEWGVFSGPLNFSVSIIAETLTTILGTLDFVSYAFINMVLNTLDKAMSIWLACLIVRVIPKNFKIAIENGVWRQRPLSRKELSDIELWRNDLRKSSRTRMMRVLIGISLVLVAVMGWIGIRLYFDNAQAEKTEIARNAVRFASEVIDTDRIDSYIEDGRAAEGYTETEILLNNIRSTASGVEYLYVYKVDSYGCTYIFDLESEDGKAAYKPGHVKRLSKEFEPYHKQLMAGQEIEPIRQNRMDKWLITINQPVKNADGITVCYVGADVSLDYMADYMQNFIFRVFTILAGFFMVIVSYGIWTTDVYNAYPVSSLARCVDKFAEDGYEQDTLDDNVRMIRRLDIHTGDEVEKLYHAISQMTLNQAEQIRYLRKLSDSTAKMQEGLIITMANMVENRDSDTGAHIQKTAAYVKIIAEGLRKKGYYAEKITPKFISDVVRSAPLHDVGKINIPDSVLNKPGKLTPEEFEVMKTHTTAGKKIIEQAISTVQGENYLKEARNMAAYHHERWDGKGYPERLHGEVIPLSARIMAVADVFDALTSPRVYKPAFPIEEALSMLKEGAGSQFDPRCIEVFMESIPEVKVILSKYNKSE